MSVPVSPLENRPFVNTRRDGGLVTLTLARGERFNPLSSAMIEALQIELDAIAGNPAARVVVLAADGKGFSAGHDLREMLAHAEDKTWQRRLFDDCSRMMMT